jgi:hypothetical protein
MDPATSAISSPASSRALASAPSSRAAAMARSRRNSDDLLRDILQRAQGRRVVFHDADHGRVTIVDFQQRTVLAALEHRIAPGGLEDGAIGSDPRATLARHTFDGADLVAKLFRGRLQAVGVLEGDSCQRLSLVVKAILRAAAPIITQQFILCFFEARAAAALDVVELDDVPAELVRTGSLIVPGSIAKTAPPRRPAP